MGSAPAAVGGVGGGKERNRSGRLGRGRGRPRTSLPVYTAGPGRCAGSPGARVAGNDLEALCTRPCFLASDFTTAANPVWKHFLLMLQGNRYLSKQKKDDTQLTMPCLKETCFQKPRTGHWEVFSTEKQLSR